MTKIRNAQGIAVALAAANAVGDVVMIGARACRVISKSSPTRGVVSMTGAVTVTKATGRAWTQFENIYWSASNSNFTDESSGNTLAGVAYAPAAAGDTEGILILNGLPAIYGD